MKNTIKTKFGSVGIYNGYYKITSSKEGNGGKYLHRAIYEEHHRCTLLRNAIIHHIDGNKKNNDISNLQLMTRGEHNSIHKSGIKNHNYGKPLPKKTCEKISKAHKGKKFSPETCKKISNAKKGDKNWSAKYTLWDIRCVHFNKSYFDKNNPLRKAFKVKFNGKHIPMGTFNEFLSCQIIDTLVREAIQ